MVLLCLFLPCAYSQDAEENAEKNAEEKTGRIPLIPSDGLVFGLPEKLDFSLGMDIGYDKVLWLGVGARMDYTAGPFDLTADIVFLNDQKYTPAAVMNSSGDIGGFYFLLNEGGLSYKEGPLQIMAGRYRNYDEINSPYSLFLNSNGISANTIKFRWETPRFFYQTQWIELNWNSGTSSPAWNEYNRRKEKGGGEEFRTDEFPDDASNSNTGGLKKYGFPDRGINYKVYGLKINDWRIGFIDVAVYSGRPFDLYYFLVPLPMYFSQYIRTTEGRPWSTQMNDNNMMGLFWDVNKETWDAYYQFLIDDFALYFFNDIFGTDFSKNPWKAAWSVGGRIRTSVGTFGFHHAGALKYTFSPVGVNESGLYAWDSANTAYGYSYYPETRYYDGSRSVNLLIQDTMIGYKYGENNLAFQVDYQNTFNDFLVTTELELLLAGNNSPANPWHQYDSRSNMYKDGKKKSQLFNDGQIEKKLELRINVSRKFGNLGAYAALAIGGRFNRLELRPPGDDPNGEKGSPAGANNLRTVDDESWIWKASDNHEFVFRFSVGFRYVFPVL